MKHILIITFFFLGTVANATQSSNNDLITQECTALAKLINQLPKKEQPALRDYITSLTRQASSVENLQEQLATLRTELTRQAEARFIGQGVDPFYAQQAASFQGVWYALLCCGAASALFLLITAIQDADARKILDSRYHKHNHLNKIHINQDLLRDAARKTAEVARAISITTRPA